MRPPSKEVIVIEDDSSDFGSLDAELTGGFFTLPEETDEPALGISPSRSNYAYDTDPNFYQPPEPVHIRPPAIVTDPKILYQLYLDKILEVFPDICLDHARSLYDARCRGDQEYQVDGSDDDISQLIIMQILDAGKYPKEKDKKKKLKRKRSSESGSDGEEAEWLDPDRPANSLSYGEIVHRILQKEFVNIPQRYLDSKFNELRYLYPTYMALELMERTYKEIRDPPYQKLKTPRKPRVYGVTTTEPTGHELAEIDRELRAAKKKLEIQQAQRRKMQDAVDADLALDQQYLESGDMVECQCCFTDTPTPKSTYCNGDDTHFFCLECARSNAKSQIELSRYTLTCMDGSGCKAEFARDQKRRFLDTKTINLLERLQQQAELRKADLTNLEKCPFCDYAAICPPVEIDREFRCCMPECERVSCRLCKLDSHIPLTCEEYRKENGLSERHTLEEAMTKALIRPCPKCNVPILKDGGCNKLVCTQCRCCVCDYCGKDITKSGYSHFAGNGGRGQGCPPSDDTDRRNATRVNEAEKEAMAKIRLENPSLSEDDLRIKFSKEVQTKLASPPPRPNNVDRFNRVLEAPLHHNVRRPMIEELRRRNEVLAQHTRELRHTNQERHERMFDRFMQEMAQRTAENLEIINDRLEQEWGQLNAQIKRDQANMALSNVGTGVPYGHQFGHYTNDALANTNTQVGGTHTPLPAFPYPPGYQARNREPFAYAPPVTAPAGPYGGQNLQQAPPARYIATNPLDPTNQYMWNNTWAQPPPPPYTQPMQQQQQQQGTSGGRHGLLPNNLHDWGSNAGYQAPTTNPPLGGKPRSNA